MIMLDSNVSTIYFYNIFPIRDSNSSLINVIFQYDGSIILPDFVKPTKLAYSDNFMSIGCASCNNGNGAIYVYRADTMNRIE